MRPKPLFSFTKPVTIPFDKDGEIKVAVDVRLLPDRPLLNMPVAGPLSVKQRIKRLKRKA